jgi:hypothetical protein
MTIELTSDAKLRFEQYLQRMRESMRGRPVAETAEVEQNVREHVEVALTEAPAPVGTERLAAVLEQLGPPEQWLPEEERPAWRRTMDRLMRGPEDWRLPYLSVGLMVLMLFTLPMGGFLLLLPAFLVSRAWVAVIEERGETLDARRWLVLPPIVIAFVSLLFLTVIGVVVLAGAAAVEHDLRSIGIPEPGTSAEAIFGFSGYILSAAGVWWLVLSLILVWLLEPIRNLFSPILTKVRRRHLLIFAGVAAVCLVIGLGLMGVSQSPTVHALGERLR